MEASLPLGVKPNSKSPLEDKERFIKLKYNNKESKSSSSSKDSEILAGTKKRKIYLFTLN